MLERIMAEDHVQTDAIWNGGIDAVGRERMSRGIRGFRVAYPDLKFEVLYATGDAQGSKVRVICS